MIRVALVGATGRTGRVLAAALEAAGDVELVARVAPSLADAGDGAFGSLEQALAASRPDVAVDFTRPELVERHAGACLTARVPLVLGTSGVGPDRRAWLDGRARAAGVPVVWAANFALGAALALRLAELAARVLARVEIVEQHSEHKRDAPSGTAALTAERLEAVTGAPVPVHSVRLPGLVAHQEVLFGAEGQLLTIRHDAFGREAYVPGVLAAVRAIRGLPPGLTEGLDALLPELRASGA